MASISAIQDLNDKKVGLAAGTEYKITVTSEAASLGLSESEHSDSTSYGIDALLCEKNQDGYYTLIGRGRNLNTSINIDTFNGEPITEIANNAFINDKTLEHITLPKSIKKIGASAFSGCISLKSITIEDSDETVIFFKNTGNWKNPHLHYTDDSNGGSQWPGVKMKSWSADEKIYCFAIPSTAKSIIFNSGDNVYRTSEITDRSFFVNNMCFEAVEREEAETLPDNDGDGVFDGYITHSTKTDYYVPQNFDLYESLTIGESAFKGCSALAGVEIPKRVVNIGASAFSDCTSYGTLTFPNSSRLVNIGSGAFQFCEALTSVKLPIGLATMGSGAFQLCTNLYSVEIPAQTLTVIPHSAFYGCTSLRNATFSYNTPVSGTPKISEIRGSAFQNCENLISIDIPATVTAIAPRAFTGCRALDKVYFKNRNGWFASKIEAPAAGDLVYLTPQLTVPGTDASNRDAAATMLKEDYGHYGDGAPTYGNWWWCRRTQMIKPTISREGNILTMTDPLGLAETFYIYVNLKNDGSYSHRVTIEVPKS